MWSSITYQPVQLMRAMVGGQVWKRPLPLAPEERVPVTLADGPPTGGGSGPESESEVALEGSEH